MLKNLLIEKIKNNKDNDKPIVTSATIKTSNYATLQKKSVKLNIPIYQLAILCFEYLIKNHHAQLEKNSGTVKYNKSDNYSTMGIIYEDQEKYEFFRSFRIINQYSVSFLIDTAVEMYLSMVIKEILQKIKNSESKNLDFLDRLILSIQTNTTIFNKKVNSNHFISYFYQFDFF